ncbi:phage tail family protein [Pediococcus acidilactici]
MSDDIVIQRDNEVIHLKDWGVRVISFDPSSANSVQETTQVGIYGAQTTSSKVGELTLTLVFDFLADDKYDFELIRLKLLGLFATPGAFYIWSTRVPYLRWKVAVQGSVNIPRYESSDVASNDITVTMVCSDGYAESVATTLDPLTSTGKWGLGMNLTKNPKPEYQFTNTNSFRFFNASNIPLLAEERPVKIHFNGVVGKSLAITNKTTSQTLIINHALKKNYYVVKRCLFFHQGTIKILHVGRVFTLNYNLPIL